MDNVLERIMEIAAQVFECEVDKETSQANCEKWDSLHHLNLVVELEMEFEVSFEPEEIAQMISIKEVEEVLKHK